MCLLPQCGGAVVTVEDHYPEGGLGSAVADAIADVRGDIMAKRLAVGEVPKSGVPKVRIEILHCFSLSRAFHRLKIFLQELMKKYGFGVDMDSSSSFSPLVSHTKDHERILNLGRDLLVSGA